MDLAQFMYRSEVRLRTNILGEPPRHIRPLSESKCVVVLLLLAHYGLPIFDPH